MLSAPSASRRIGALQRFRRAEDGATAIEYAVIAALIGGMLAATLPGFSGKLSDTYKAVSDRISEINAN